jgi:hypothetical protein
MTSKDEAACGASALAISLVGIFNNRAINSV